MNGIVYALCYREVNGAERVFYIGRTRKALQVRLEEHRRGALDPFNPKPAYEFIRASNLIGEFYAIEICQETEFTEAEIIYAARHSGQPLMNASQGDSIIPRLRRQRSTFSKLNRQALGKMLP